jgi:hypothetical protein
MPTLRCWTSALWRRLKSWVRVSALPPKARIDSVDDAAGLELSVEEVDAVDNSLYDLLIFGQVCLSAVAFSATLPVRLTAGKGGLTEILL